MLSALGGFRIVSANRREFGNSPEGKLWRVEKLDAGVCLAGQASAGTRKLLCLKFRPGHQFAQKSAN